MYLDGIPKNVNDDPALPTDASPIKNVTFDNFTIQAADYTWSGRDSKFLDSFPSTLGERPRPEQ